MSITEWTKEQPTEPGWYWAKPFGGREFVYIVWVGLSLTVFLNEYEQPGCEFRELEDYSYWMGPIAEPELPK